MRPLDHTYQTRAEIMFCNWLQSDGWTYEGTGGGCVAWQKETPAKMYWLLTDEDGSDVPRDVLTPCLVGLYDDEGQSMDPQDTPLAFGTVAEAIRHVNANMADFARIAASAPHTTVTHNADGSTTYRNPEPCNPTPERNDVPSHDCA